MEKVISSSLFDICEYSSNCNQGYLLTKKISGNKGFGELKPGDIIYKLVYKNNNYLWIELSVTKEWHIKKGRCYISCLCNKEKINIDFGPSSSANVTVDSFTGSIAVDGNEVIGTSKECVFKFKLNYLKEELAQLQERCTIQTENITNLTKSFNNNN